MANQPKKYQKFVATAATATLVASAIVPVASAAEKKFTDIEKYAQETQDAIYSLVDRGVITGKSDSVFAPAELITRGQVVKMMGRYLVNDGVAEVPSDWNTKQRFSDVPVDHKDQDLVKNAAVVFDNGVFKGSNNKLNVSNNISRENMALVLDRAIGALNGKTLVELAKEEGLKGNVKDINLAKAEARDAIQALNAFGISEVDNFKPKNNVTRAQFALFLERTIDSVLSDTVEELVEKAVVAGNALPKPEDVTKENANDAQQKVDFAQKALDKAQKALDADEELTSEEKLALQQKLDKVKDQIEAVKKAIAETELGSGITSVKAINDTTVEVKFGKAIDKDFIREAEQSGEYFAIYKYGETIRGAVIQSETVSFSEDGKSAEFVLKGAIQSGERYHVSLLDGPDTKVAKEVHTYGPTELRESAKQPDFEVSAVSDKIQIDFSEKMKDTALKVDNYTVYDNGGKKIGDLSTFVKEDEKGEWVNAIAKTKVEFTLDPEAKQKLRAGETYQIRLTTNLETDKNNTLNKDKLVIKVKTPTVKEAAPKVTQARVVDETHIVLVFDKDVNEVQLANLQNLVDIQTATGKRVNTDSIKGEVGEIKNEVILTLDPAKTEDELDRGTTYKISVPGNIVNNAVFPNAANEATSDIRATAQDNKAIASFSAKLQADAKDRESADLVLTFDQRPTLKSVKDAIEAGDIVIKDGGDTYKATGSVVVKYLGSDKTGKSVVVEGVNKSFEYDNDAFSPSSADSYVVEIKAGTVAVDAFGGTGVTNQQKLKATINGVSVTAPLVDRVVLESAEKMVIEFEEDIDSTIDLNKITVAGFEADQNKFYSEKALKGKSYVKGSVSGNKLTLTTAKDGVKFATGSEAGSLENLVKFEKDAVVSKGSNLSIKDKEIKLGQVDGGKLDGVKFVDNAAPIILYSTAVNDSDIQFTFSENIDTEGDVAPQFRTGGAAAKSSVGKEGSANESENKLDVTFTDDWRDSSTDELDVTVDYRTGSTTYIKDAVGNKVKSIKLMGVKTDGASSITPPADKEANKTALTSSIKDAKKALETVEADKKADLDKAIKDAEAVEADKKATQTEVDKAKENLDKAVEAAKETGDTVKAKDLKLEAAIEDDSTTSITVEIDKLDPKFADKKLVLVYEGTDYELVVNRFNKNILETELPKEVTQSEVDELEVKVISK